MRGNLTNQIKKLSDDVNLFQRNTNERLQKIESVITKVEEIDGVNFKQQELEAGFDSLKNSLSSIILTPKRQTTFSKATTTFGKSWNI